MATTRFMIMQPRLMVQSFYDGSHGTTQSWISVSFKEVIT